MERELERLFLAYRTDGDSGALAAVFDQAAPEILKVAIHLTRDAAEAEDLLQATFIVAIEKADRFDGSRRLVPWLLGILTNLWRQRRAHRSPDPDRLPRREAADPSAAAERREMTEEVAKAIERVPEPYRRVLRMRLEDGLEPAAIAHTLDRAPGTVRSQIHRGLDLLRRALPAGLAIGAVAATRGLAAVRADVLKAAVAASPTRIALVGGLLMTKKKLVLIAALVLSLGGGVILSQRWWGPSPAPRSTGARGPVVSEAPPPDARPPRADGQDREPGHTSSARRPVVGVPAEVKHVTGYGSVDVKVAWRAIAKPSVECLAIHLAVGTLFHETRETDTEGVAHFVRVPVGLAVATCLDASAAGGSTQVQAGRHADMTLHMSPPRRELVAVEGDVVAASGRPVAGAWIRVPTLSAAMVVATTDEGGRFVLPSIRTGTYVQAGASGYAPSEPFQLTDAGERVRLVLPGRGGAFVGRVVDATGRPVAGASVDVHTNVRIRLRTTTNDRGRFHFEGMAPGTLPVHVRRRGHASWTGEVVTVAGSVTETEIELEQGGAIYGQVTDGRRNPLSGVRLTVSKSMALAHTDREGSYRIEDVRPGPVRLIANARAGGRATATVEVVAGGETRQDIALIAPATITGRLVDDAGDPLPGWRISLRANRFHLDQATVGDDGSFAFTKPTKPEHRFLLHVFASKEAKLPVLVVPDVKGSAKDLVIAIPADAVPSCHVTGRVADEGGTSPARFRVALVGVDSGARGAYDFEASDREAFRIGPVPPGTYDVLVYVHDPAARVPLVYRAKSGPHVLRARTVLDLGTVTVAAPGAIVLRLRPEDVEKFPGVTCWLKGTEVQRRAGVVPGAREIRIDDLPPGTYGATLNMAGMASVVLTDLTVEPRRTATRDVLVTEGVSCALVFRMGSAPETARSLHVRAVDADGNCVMDDWYTQSGPKTFWGGTWAAPRTYTVEAETKTGERARGQFTVPEGAMKPTERLDVELN